MELFTEDEYNKAKYRDLLLCKCDVCGNSFLQMKKNIYNNRKFCKKHNLCSKKCQSLLQSKQKLVICKNCGKEFFKKEKDILRSKSGNNFCSSSCAASYNNSHKIYGYRRSKFEKYVEEVLKETFPNLEIIYNNSHIIGYELDIYIPSLKLAFEINGIFHYKPIFGEYKFQRTQEIDKAKLNECEVQGIQLIVIDISNIKTFSKENSKFLIKEIINKILDVCSV